MSVTDQNIRQIMYLLYRDHHGWLLGWLYRKLNCRHQAADLAQDTFVRALSSPQAEQIQEPRAFLMTLAKRTVFEFWRRRDLEKAYLEALASMPEAMEPSAEELTLVYEAVELLDKLLSGLPNPVKQAFLLNRLDGMTHVDIAKQMQVSVATIERYVKRALVQCCLVQQGLS